MKSRTALAILTYVDRHRPDDVRRRLPEALASLHRTNYRDPVFIVDDGSTCARHLQYLDELAADGRYQVVRRERNGGISRAKNTCLRCIAGCDVDVGFLAEDDILFREGWHDAYVAAVRRSAIQHFSWYPTSEQERVVACNGLLVRSTSGLLGLLMAFTREVLARVGGFKILPHRYGYEHIQWTYRTIVGGLAPFPCDLVESQRFIECNTLPSSICEEEIRAGAAQNRPGGYVIERLFEAFEE
jgi:hypothetical protein